VATLLKTFILWLSGDGGDRQQRAPRRGSVQPARSAADRLARGGVDARVACERRQDVIVVN
jgi:hypothetical protein